MGTRCKLLRASLALIVCTTGAIAQAQTAPPEPLYPVFQDGRWGLINAEGRLVLPPRFEKVAGWPEGFPPGLSSPVRAWLDIKMARETVTDAVIPIVLDGKAGFATRDGELLALGRYEQTEWRFREGRIWMRSGGRVGFADERGEPVIPPQFDKARWFDGGYAFVMVGNRWGVIDRHGQWMAPPTWDEIDHTWGDAWAKARTGDRWGAVDRAGKVVIPLRFDDIMRPIGPLIFAVDSGRPVYLRQDGSVAFEVKCPKGLFDAPKAQGSPFFPGGKSAVVKCGDGYGLIDPEGKFLLEPKWALIQVEPDEHRARIRSGRKEGVIDEEGRFIVALQKFPPYPPYDCGDGLWLLSLPGPKAGFVDAAGRTVIPATYNGLTCFDEAGMAVAVVGGKAGFIDRTGAWVIQPKFSAVTPFRGALAITERPVSKDTMELDYIDRAGKVVYRMHLGGFINEDWLVRKYQ